MGVKITEFTNKTKSLGEMLKKYKYIMIVLVAGIIILLIPWGSGSDSGNMASQELMLPEFSLEKQEKKMEEALSKIDGAGNVTVMLTLKSDMEQEIAVDEDIRLKTEENGSYESDSKRKAVSLQVGAGRQSPVTVKYIYPCYQGALVITQNSSPEVKLQLVQAVAALTGLSTDRITVVKGI